MCQKNSKLGTPSSCDFGACVPSSSAIGCRLLQAETQQSASKNTSTTSGGGSRRFQCRMSASYAEGSTWNAIEASDVVHPFGPTTMNDANDDNTMDFRLKFGCQTKVSDKLLFAVCTLQPNHTKRVVINRIDLQLYTYRSPDYSNISSRMAYWVWTIVTVHFGLSFVIITRR